VQARGRTDKQVHHFTAGKFIFRKDRCNTDAGLCDKQRGGVDDLKEGRERITMDDAGIGAMQVGKQIQRAGRVSRLHIDERLSIKGLQHEGR
jgi:hypothetical protein